MTQNKNPFRVQPIRKTPWYLRFLVLVISGSLVFAGVQFAAAALRNPSVTNLSTAQTAPSDTANITAGIPSTPSDAPTGSNSVIPFFSGLNVSGPIFSELSGDASAEARPLQFYDHVNFWGDLNIVGGEIRNTNSSGSGVIIDDALTIKGSITDSDGAVVVADEFIVTGNISDADSDVTVNDGLSVVGSISDPNSDVMIEDGLVVTGNISDWDSDVTIGDTLTVTDVTTLQGNLQLQNVPLVDSSDHRVNIVDNLRIQGQNNSSGANDLPTLTLHRTSGQVDLVMTTVFGSGRRNWKIATGLSNVDSGTGLFIGADLDNDNSYSQGMRLEHVSGSNYTMTVNGDINATNDIFASGKIGHFYQAHRDVAPPISGGGTFLEITASCYTGDIRIGCTAFQDGTTSRFKGAWPLSSARSCEAKSVRNGNNDPNDELHLWAFCFSPDGQQAFSGATKTIDSGGTILSGITIDGISYTSTNAITGLMIQGYTENGERPIVPGDNWTDPPPPGAY